MVGKLIFVNVDDPVQFRDKAHMKTVYTHIGRFYRNRSRPTGRKETVVKVKSHQPLLPRHCKSSNIDHAKPGGSGRAATNAPHKAQESSEQTVLAASTGLSKSSAQSHSSATLYCISFDPLQGCAPPQDQTSARELIHYAVSEFWSIATPATDGGPANPANGVYLMHMQCSNLAYYTYNLAISNHYDFSRRYDCRAKFTDLRVRYAYAATQIIRSYIQELPDQPAAHYISDALIVSVITLSANSNTSFPVVNAPSRFESPLAKAQCIDMWGSQPLVQPHRVAVARLLALRGGLRKLSSLATVISCQLLDLIDASYRSNAPLIPYESLVCPLADLQWPHNPTEDCKNSRLTLGFLNLPNRLVGCSDLTRAISAIAHTISSLDTYQRQCYSKCTIGSLIELRNRAQYLTLSLDDDLTKLDEVFNVGDADDLLEANCLYQILKLSLLIFNNIVVYPMPPCSGVGDRLSSSLEIAMVNAIQVYPQIVRTQTDLLLWSSLLGGIGGDDDASRERFAKLFNRILELKPDARAYADCDPIFQSFLWSDSILAKEAQWFWNECTILRLVVIGKGKP